MKQFVCLDDLMTNVVFVCRAWRHLVQSAEAWHTMHFKGGPKRLRTLALNAPAMPRAVRSLKAEITADVYRTVGRVNNWVPVPVDSNELRELLQWLRTGSDKLSSLDLTCSDMTVQRYLPEWIDVIPLRSSALRSLAVRHFNLSWSLSAAGLARVPHVPPPPRAIHLASSLTTLILQDVDVGTSCVLPPGLTTLCLTNVCFVRRAVMDFAACATSLVSLAIAGAHVYDNHANYNFALPGSFLAMATMHLGSLGQQCLPQPHDGVRPVHAALSPDAYHSLTWRLLRACTLALTDLTVCASVPMDTHGDADKDDRPSPGFAGFRNLRTLRLTRFATHAAVESNFELWLRCLLLGCGSAGIGTSVSSAPRQPPPAPPALKSCMFQGGFTRAAMLHDARADHAISEPDLPTPDHVARGDGRGGAPGHPPLHVGRGGHGC
jgi:hypothetical protein